MVDVVKNSKELLENCEATWDAYNDLYPTLSEFAWKLPQNRLMVGMKFRPKEIGKVLYVWLHNDAADIHFDDNIIYSKGTKGDIEDEEKKKFSNLMSKLIEMQADEQMEIKLGFTNSKKSYRLHKDKDGYVVINNTDTNTKNARKEGGGTSPDPREDSLDYGARGGNSAAPTQLGYNV